MKRKILHLVILIASVALLGGCGESDISTKSPSPTIETTETENPITTPTETLTPTETSAPTETPTVTETVTPSVEPTEIPEATQKPSLSITTPTPVSTATPVPTVTIITPTPAPTVTPVPTVSIVTPTETPMATNTPVPTATNTPTPEPTATSTPAPTATSTPKPTQTPSPSPTPVVVKKDISKYLVHETDDKGNGQSVYKNYDKDNVNTNVYDVVYRDPIETTSGTLGFKYKAVYEITERPDFAGKVKTVTLSDKDLLPENLLKYNLQVGDIVKTESFTYEQDGNSSNGEEAIEWEVVKVQYIYTVYPFKANMRTYKLRGSGANLSASYFLRATKTLDYDEYFKFENWTQLYSGTALTNQTYTSMHKKEGSELDNTFVFDTLHGADVDFTYDLKNTYWNTCNTTAYTGMISIYKSAEADMRAKPTAYALSKGIPVTNDGYVKYNWLYGTSPYLINDKEIDFRGLSVSYDGNLKWNSPYGDKAGFRPEMTLWTGVDTAGLHDDYDVTSKDLSRGSWRALYEINYEIWKELEDFTIWKLP